MTINEHENTEDLKAVESLPDPAEALEAAQEAPDAAEVDDTKAGREAARYRRQLRETETVRDALAARLATLQTAEVERLATGPDGLAMGADLWPATALADLLDDGGNVDASKVAAAVAARLVTHPHYAYRLTVREQWALAGSADAGVRGNPATAPSWAGVLRGA